MFEYYPMRLLRELPDGHFEAAMTYASEDWMSRLVLGFGSAVRIVAPDSWPSECATPPRRRWTRTWPRRGPDSTPASCGSIADVWR